MYFGMVRQRDRYLRMEGTLFPKSFLHNELLTQLDTTPIP